MKLRTFCVLLVPLSIVAAVVYVFFPYSLYLIFFLPLVAGGILFSWSGLLLLMEMRARKKGNAATSVHSSEPKV